MYPLSDLANLSNRSFTLIVMMSYCDLRLLGLRTTVELLKQLPAVLEAKPVGEGD